MGIEGPLCALLLCVLWSMYTPTPSEKGVNDVSFQGNSLEGNIDLGALGGKVVVVVNTASECGFTYQYGQLEEIYKEYKDQGVEIIAVPSNDFGGQEPLDNDGINEFCSAWSFPVAKKTELGSHPFYKLLSSKDGLGWMATPRWNFWKVIVGKNGKIINWFSSLTPPNSILFRRALDQAVGQI
mmetsp:Transcript_14412/g.23455  ORF Transcript_14412/g.23455 Transcript_14412/m.23455 type:complete len:183 (-) Transcript_14412:592-1140(-)